MTKGVKICIAFTAVILVISAIMTFLFMRPSDSERVVVIRDGEVLYSFDLSKSENQTIRVEYEGGGYNIIEIKDGAIKISDADCPDKTCVKSGTLDYSGLPIVCLPHHLIVRYE